MGGYLEQAAPQSWSTADVDSRDAVAYWVDSGYGSFVEIDIDRAERRQFRARLSRSSFGPATRFIIETDPHTVRRTPARISHSGFNSYFLMRLSAGRLRYQQFGRDVCLEAGDSILVDFNAPYRLDCLCATHTMLLRFPRIWLRNWLPAPEDFACRPFRYNAGWSSALSAALACIDTDCDELALPEGVVAEQIAALLALAVGRDARALRGCEKLLNRIRGTIRDRCHETGLTPGAVADGHGISKRYLHHLFAQANSTFGCELMRTRLDCASRLLSDTRYTQLTISEVAARCGFLDPSHFARCFRKAHGIGPVEFRTARLHN